MSDFTYYSEGRPVMGEKMTLEQVRDWHLKRVEFFSHGGMPWGAMAHESQQCADAITAHLTQPSQAVDVGGLVAVYDAVHRSCLTRDVKTPETKARIVRNALTAALHKDSSDGN